MARFLRSDVARVDRFGVRYHAAAKFDDPLDILTPQAEQTRSALSRSPHSSRRFSRSRTHESPPGFAFAEAFAR